MSDLTGALSNALVAMVSINAIVYALAAIGLNVHFGYAGLLNFGQAAFAMVGAYGLALIVTSLDLPLGLGIVAGLFGGVLLALVLGIPTLRLRADYLAIATIAVAEITRLVLRSNTFRAYFGGADGISGFSAGFYALNPIPDRATEYGFGPFSYSARELFPLVVGWLVVGFACLFVFMLMRSPWGRVLKAIREDEDAVRSLGKNVFGYRVQALVIGGVLGSTAGLILGLARGAAIPDNFNPEFTFLAYTALLIGGAARVFGPVLGSLILWFTISLTDGALQAIVSAGASQPLGLGLPSWLVMSAPDTGAVRFMLIGAVLMLLMVFRPQGILGDRRELTLDVR